MLLLLSNVALGLNLQRLAQLPAGGGACKGPSDCNAGNDQNCKDCTCESSSTGMVCSCADGYLGPHCTIPMCNATYGCSGHGKCEYSKAGVACSCETGYGGANCSIVECTLNCQHGGIPNKDCSKCNCFSAWSGDVCDSWNASTAPAIPVQYVESNIVDQQNAINKQSPQHPLCTSQRQCAGWCGLENGELGNINCLVYTTDPEKPKIHGYQPPANSEIQEILSPQAQVKTPDVMRFYPDYQSIQSSMQATNSGRGGFWGSGIYTDADKKQMFEGPQTFGISVTQAHFGIFTDESRTPMKLDNKTCDNVNALGPDYSTPASIAVCNRVMEEYGPSYIVNAVLGGMIEQISQWQTQYFQDPGVDFASMQNNAAADFYGTTKLGPVPQQPQDASYRSNRTFKSMEGNGTCPWNCYGGDITKCCNISAWKLTLWQSPIILDYKIQLLRPLTQQCGDDAPQRFENCVEGYNKAHQSSKQVVCNSDSCLNGGYCATDHAESCTCPCSSGRHCEKPICIGDCCLGTQTCGARRRLFGDTPDSQYHASCDNHRRRRRLQGLSGRRRLSSTGGKVDGIGINMVHMHVQADADLFGTHGDMNVNFPRNILNVSSGCSRTNNVTAHIGCGCGGDCSCHAECTVYLENPPRSDTPSWCTFPNKCRL